ncbi:MAG: DUF3822 family protein [Odoribacteraceae bacterium]|nr:DUF3822 family protein [Odoribacteraceae bacterium]
MRRAHHFAGKPGGFAPPGATLSISHGIEGCSFCVHDAGGEVVAFAHEPYEDDAPGARFARLQEVVAAEPLLAGEYGRVIVATNYREKMLLPDRFCREEQLPLLWSFHHETPASGHFPSYPVEEWQARVVSVLPDRTRQLFRQLQPGCRFLPGGASLARLAARACRDESDQLFIDVHGDYFDLLVTRDRRPLLFNAFHHETGQDILYFTLNAARNCHLDEKRTRLYLTGDVSPRGKLYEQFSRYWSSPRLLAEPALTAFLQDPAFNTSPFVHLLNLHACVS